MSLLILLTCALGPTGDAKKPPPAVKREPVAVAAGQPLSQRALVLKPPPLKDKDTVSWTIETRKHRGDLLSAALDPAGKRLATGGSDGFVRLWDAATGKFERALVGHDGWVFGLDFSPDGKTLASTGGRDSSVRLWDVATGMPLRVLKNKNYVHFVAWSPDGCSVAAAGGSSGFVTLWDVDKTSPVRTVEAGNEINGIAWAPDSKRLAVAGLGMSVRIWDIREGEGGKTFEVPGKNAYRVAWSPDGKTLVATSPGKTFAWAAESGEVVREFTFGSRALAFSAKGSLAAYTGDQARVWPPGGFDKKPAVIRQQGGMTVHFAPDESLFVGTSKAVAHWRADGTKELRTIEVAAGESTQYTPGRPLITGVGTSEVSLWNLTTGKRIAKLDGLTDRVTAAAWSTDGKLLATASADKLVRIWDAAGQLVRSLEGHDGPVNCVAWADGKTLASGSVDQTVRLWKADADAGKVLWKHEGSVLAVAWSRSGKLLASGADEAKVFIGSPEGKTPREVASEPTRVLAWSPTGKNLAAGASTGGLRLINPATGKVQQEWDAPGNTPELRNLAWVSGLAWSPEGALLLAGRASFTADVVRVGTPKVVSTLYEMHAPTAVAWGPVGTTAILSAGGRSVRAYDLPNGGLRATMFVVDDQLVTVSSTGHYRAADEGKADLVYIVQTRSGQDVYEPKAFEGKFRLKNSPTGVRLSGK